MSPDPNVPNAVLICSTGALAGSRFEVGAETTIGADSGGQLRVAQGAAGFTSRYARVVADGERHRIEPLGGAAEVTIDGVAISSPTPLEKRHSIGVRGVAEFVYSRSAAPAAKPAEPPAAVAPPAAPAAPPPTPAAAPQPQSPPRDMGTMIEKGGFEALPDLVRRPTPAAKPIPAAPPPPPPPPTPAPPAAPPAVDKGTMMAKGGFDALPDLVRRPTPVKPPVVPPPPPPPAPTAPPLETPQQRGRYTPFADQVAVPPAPPPPPPPPPVAKAPPPPPPVAPPPPPRPLPPPVSDEEEGATVVGPAPVILSGMQLVLTLEGHGRVAYDLKIGDNIVGRGKDADIKIPDPKKWLSRQHVNVRASRDKVELIDLGGANGTYVNGKKITTAIITPGAGFDLGPSMAFTLRKT